MNLNINKFWEAAHHMADTFISRLPALVVAVIVFILFYFASMFVGRLIRRATPKSRQNLGVVFGRLMGGVTVLLGFLVAFSIVAPSFQASDLVKVLGISGVAIGFAFQNILQNFLAGLLLLWAEPFRVGDEIKLDPYEGTVKDIQTRATIIKTYDGRQVVIPNADLFTHSVIVNTAYEKRRWEFDLPLKNTKDVEEIKKRVLDAVRSVAGILQDPPPEALMVGIQEPGSNSGKLKVLWWTKEPRQHEMLNSYDRVLTAIAQRFSDAESEDRPKAA
ncbi:MAG TPA: mechanosensitive ion channel domain-containing protein [Candidatus Koribacter sp.]|jgi:small-conductance mechanosensitive channel